MSLVICVFLIFLIWIIDVRLDRIEKKLFPEDTPKPDSLKPEIWLPKD